MNDNYKPAISKYFAAANSYKGFVSFFDKVFPSEKFDRIYVLKGGPGTGKSSFMKKISASLKEGKKGIEEIYCSSDPNSLDGLIAENNGKRIAILDGTAPHERDAVIPGAIDEIINLGNGWDSRWLKAKKDKILRIGKEKSAAYKCAYSYLKVAGSADDFIMNIYQSIFDENKAKNKAEEILSDISTSQKQQITTRLISSFGRYGYHKINGYESDLGRILRVSGDEYSSYLFIKKISETAYLKGISFVNLLSPLNPSTSEGISLISANLTVLKADVGDINSIEFLTDDKVYSERTRRAKEIRKIALEEAERWFSIASELHFQLEEIYSEAMDFNNNNKILAEKLHEIENILQN